MGGLSSGAEPSPDPAPRHAGGRDVRLPAPAFPAGPHRTEPPTGGSHVEARGAPFPPDARNRLRSGATTCSTNGISAAPTTRPNTPERRRGHQPTRPPRRSRGARGRPPRPRRGSAWPSAPRPYSSRPWTMMPPPTHTIAAVPTTPSDLEEHRHAEHEAAAEALGQRAERPVAPDGGASRRRRPAPEPEQGGSGPVVRGQRHAGVVRLHDQRHRRRRPAR